jgi:RNA recognition motif-containing protein
MLQSASLANSKQIVVERLTKNVNEDHLYEIFGQYGEIDDLDLPIGKHSEYLALHGLSSATSQLSSI